MLYAFWFRKDLRLIDNKALSEFISVVKNKFNPKQDSILFFYIKNRDNFSYYGEKRINFLYQCLNQLSNSLEMFGFKLIIFRGNAIDTIKKIYNSCNPLTLFANKQYEPYNLQRDNAISSVIKNGVFNLFNDSVLTEPGSIIKDDGNPYVIFTPYKRKFLSLLNQDLYKDCKSDLLKIKEYSKYQINVANLDLDYLYLNKLISKSSGFFKGGREQGLKLLDKFITKKIYVYHKQRDYPCFNGTSFISPYLHFGTISVRECFKSALSKLKGNNSSQQGVSTWIGELIWREFYYQITFHFPYIIKSAFKKEYDNIQWENDEIKFEKWCNGLTGCPIVDAGMRQLVKEGWMHNRVRMITAMFLTKDLLIDWKWGEKFFAKHLVDFDFACNNGGWQWSASTGCDAQPYFRIFNPYLQSMKFDPKGLYIKKYIPELNSLDSKNIHKPDLDLLRSLKYPEQLVDHNKMKEIAISKYKSVK